MSTQPTSLTGGHEVVSVKRYVLGRGLSATGRLESWRKCIHCQETRPTDAEFSDSCDGSPQEDTRDDS